MIWILVGYLVFGILVSSWFKYQQYCRVKSLSLGKFIKEYCGWEDVVNWVLVGMFWPICLLLEIL